MKKFLLILTTLILASCEGTFSEDIDPFSRTLEDQVNLNTYTVNITDRKEYINDLESLSKIINSLKKSILAPAQEDFDEYSYVLKYSNAKVIRILTDSSNPIMRGYGESYSFKNSDHSSYSSSLLVNQNLFSGVLSNDVINFMLDVGKVDLLDVSLYTKGASYFYTYNPPLNEDNFLNDSERFREGVLIEGNVYRNSASIILGHTYLQRSIDSSSQGYDILVAFTPIRIDEVDKSVILIWKLIKDFDVSATEK